MDVAGFADTLAPTGYPGRLHPPFLRLAGNRRAKKHALHKAGSTCNGCYKQAPVE